jgi:FkbM family methyltransferase
MQGNPDPINALRAGLGQLFIYQLRTRQRVYAIETELMLAREGRKPHMPIEFRSQYGEDVMIWDLLNRKTDGFFIEVGAFDGYDFSVSYALEAAGWTGLLIEAIPERAEQCKARRPRSRVVNAAVSRKGSTGTTEFVVCEDERGGMLSYIDKKSGHSHAMNTSGVPSRRVRVPLTTIDDLLADHSGPIDAAVIDVEGVELETLDGFNIERWKPRVLIIEDNSLGKDQAMANYMKTKPYIDLGWIEVNRLYVHKECDDILRTADRIRRFS